MEDKNMNNETRNDEAVSPVIATILMVAITVVLAGVLYVWAANLAESNTDGSLELYTFSGADAPTSADGALIMTMDNGQDLGWASITIKASVDGAASSTIPMCDGTVTENCWSSTDTEDTAAWNSGEAITVDTSCTSTCTVTINVLNSREGTTLDTTIVDVE
jgi:flagellin-like protein